MSEKMTDVFGILEPHGKLTAEIISSLRSMFGERLISDIGAKEPKHLAPEILALRDAHGLTNAVPAALIAKELLDFMEAMGFTGKDSKPGPLQVQLIQKTRPQDMNLQELLEALSEKPSRYNELMQYINALREIQLATLRSPNWAVTVRGKKDKLDVEATLTRVNNLVTHTIVQDKLPDGRYPTLLARVFGQEERYMLNPFAHSLDEAAVRGPIFRDFDLGNLAEVVHLAFIWARFVVSHRAWPGTIDNYDHLPQAFSPELTGRWKEIVDDYQAAKDNSDPTVEGLSRYLSPQDLRSRRPFAVSTQQRDDKWYLEQLQEASQSAIRQAGNDATLRLKIVDSVRMAGGNLYLDNAIILGGVRLSGGDISGTGYLLKGHPVSLAGGSNRADTIELNPSGCTKRQLHSGLSRSKTVFFQ